MVLNIETIYSRISVDQQLYFSPELTFLALEEQSATGISILLNELY